jgi:prepilin-type N-terminal cleavage/methylation domain-containing protein
MSHPPSRRGTTLVELIVVIALLAIVAAVATLWHGPVTQPPVDDPHQVALRSRIEAIESGRPVTFLFVGEDGPRRFTVLPDGRTLADSLIGYDLLTGKGPSGAR